MNGTTVNSAVRCSAQNLCWAYDPFGNRTIQSVSITTCPNASTVASTLVFNSANQLSGVIPPGGGSQSPSTLTYDAAGDVTNDTHTSNTYVYDAEGRVCAFETPNGLGGTTMVGYLYDGDGIRVAKGTITSMNCDPASNGFTLTEDYVLGPSGEELTMLNGSGTWQRSNVYGGGRQVATYDIAANPAYVSGNGQPTTAPALHFQILDGLGTRRVQTNADGQPETDIQSLPYGDALVTANDEYAPATADDATPLHFTSKERDAESGNDYFGARYYISSIGRFLSPDWSAKVMPVPYAKMDNPQSLNLYSYVLNDPLVVADADGHSTDIYKPDLYNHGAPHIDRETKGGKLVGRYRPDGTPMEHKGKTPPPIPSADQERFEKAAKKVRRRVEDQQEYQDDVNNRPPIPAPPAPDGLEPDSIPGLAPGPCAGPCGGGPFVLPYPGESPNLPSPGGLPISEPILEPAIAGPQPGPDAIRQWMENGLNPGQLPKPPGCQSGFKGIC